MSSSSPVPGHGTPRTSPTGRVGEPAEADPRLLSLSTSSADEVLYQGRATEVSSGRECELEVIARWGVKQDIRWTARFDTVIPNPYWDGPDHLSFTLCEGFAAGEVIDGMRVSGWDHDRLTGGLASGRIVGRTDGEIDSLDLSWVNLSDTGGGQGGVLRARDGSVDTRTAVWRGREIWNLGDWEMTVDARPDLAKVIGELKDHGGHAVTHLAVLRRADRESFSAADVTPILRAYHQAVAFALGREAAPSPATARGRDGSIVWREWSVRRADQMGGVTPWWHRNACSMDEVTRLIGAKLLDPKFGRNASHILQGYVLAKRGGFLEQRITVGFSTIEQICWQIKVFEEGVDGRRYDRKDADQRLRGMLVNAQMPHQPWVPDHLPALKQFTKREGLPTADLDGPAAVAQVRHRIVHPKDPTDLYDIPNLLPEAWVLLGRYLELLILRWSGYAGSVQDTSVIGGWAGEVKPVPWT
jgi:hypothetical protein